MARKILFGVLLVLLVASFYAYAGEVKLTTYYPAPYGEYKRVATTTLGVGDNDASGTITSADAPDPATQAGNLWVAEKLIVGPARRANPRSRFQFAAGAMEVQNPGEYPWGVSIDISCWRHYTGATPNGWAREFKFTNNEGQLNATTPNQPLADSALQKDAMFAFGVKGSGQTLQYGYIGGSTDLNAETAYLTPWMVFKPDGRVGIGTTAPTARLYVADSGGTCAVFRQSSNSANGVAIVGYQSGGTLDAPTATLDNRSLLDLGGCGYTSTTSFAGSRALISMRSTENWTATTQGAKMTFSTTANGGVATAERMCIDHNGNIGIGTMTPGNVLEVRKDTASAANGITLNNQQGIGWGSALTFKSKYTSAYDAAQIIGGGTSSQGNGVLAFLVGDGSGLAERMRINNSGWVGIRTTSPDRTLDVNGGAAFRGNHIYLVNPDCTLSPGKAWGMVVNTSGGYFSIGPTSDPLPGGGLLSTAIFQILPGTKAGALHIESNGKVHMPYGTQADYVFQPGYKLMSIEEVAEFIRTNHCLPRMGKADGNDGSANDLFSKHTEKIEELTLYVIQQNERIKTLEKKVEQLTKK